MPTDIHPSVFSLFVHVSAVKNNMALVHVSLVACVGEEQKTKPTQHRLDARLNNCRKIHRIIVVTVAIYSHTIGKCEGAIYPRVDGGFHRLSM